jgi:hypothetical protein
VADRADTIVATDPPAFVSATGYVTPCFDAIAGTASVLGFAWTYTVDGVATAPDPFHPDCVEAHPGRTATTMTVVATAGGQSATLVLPVQ